jgi:hypothetical protein
MPIYVLPASGRGFAFAKQGNKMRRLRRRTREGWRYGRIGGRKDGYKGGV